MCDGMVGDYRGHRELAELDRGETVSFEDPLRRVREIIATAEAKRTDKK